MKYTYIEEDDRTPTDEPNTKTCGRMACVHPQMVFRFAMSKNSKKNQRLVGLSTEITIPMSMVTKSNIQHIKTLEMDIVELMMMSGGYLDPDRSNTNWTPEDAVVHIHMK